MNNPEPELEPNTKDLPGAFDAFQTAKPDEPIFTLQGGDPVAAMLVQLWAFIARARAGVRPDIELDDLLEIADRAPPAETEAQSQELLLRASSAEEVAWAMRAYQRKEAERSDEGKAHEQQSKAEHPDRGEDDEALKKLLRHKLLLRLARALDNAAAEVNAVAVQIESEALDFAGVFDANDLRRQVGQLEYYSARIRPSRKASSPWGTGDPAADGL